MSGRAKSRPNGLFSFRQKCQVEGSRDLLGCSDFDFAQTDKIFLFIFFLLSQKETKTQDERPTPIFYGPSQPPQGEETPPSLTLGELSGRVESRPYGLLSFRQKCQVERSRDLMVCSVFDRNVRSRGVETYWFVQFSTEMSGRAESRPYSLFSFRLRSN